MKKLLFFTFVFSCFTLYAVNENELMWSNLSANEMSWNDAFKYCNELCEDGFCDWKLPDIDELRTRIKDCSYTKTGGGCKISNNCLSDGCGRAYRDVFYDCCLCEDKVGSRSNDQEEIWSSSQVSFTYCSLPTFRGNCPRRWWYVSRGGIFYNTRDTLTENFVRCVRHQQPGDITKRAAAQERQRERQRAEKEAENRKQLGIFVWSELSSYKMDWKEAFSYCNSLNANTYEGWRLPTINELRSLIKNCPRTVTGGLCRVSDNCNSDSCWDGARNCFCEAKSDGYYSLLGDNEYIWSSTGVPNRPDAAFGIGFAQGYIGIFNASVKAAYVRCVK